MIYNEKSFQTYLMRVGEQCYVGHTKMSLKARVVLHRSQAKLNGSMCKLHVALRATDYQCAISRIDGGVYETFEQACQNEDLWIQNYDSINNGLNTRRAITTKAEKLKRQRDYDSINKAKIYSHKKSKIACWNCNAVITRGNISAHRKTNACTAIKMNSLKLIKMYL
jgi:hypothetical protein